MSDPTAIGTTQKNENNKKLKGEDGSVVTHTSNELAGSLEGRRSDQ